MQPDLARQEEETIVLYDWKTAPGDESELRQQLGIYGVYVRNAWPELATPDALNQGIVYDLATDRLLEYELEKKTLLEMQRMIETSVAQLQGLQLDPQTNLADLRRFPMIDDLSVCRRCNFRELCGRD